jgi:hypothetical protein
MMNTSLPISAGSADLLLDRGCFHYLSPAQRAGYARRLAAYCGPAARRRQHGPSERHEGYARDQGHPDASEIFATMTDTIELMPW